MTPLVTPRVNLNGNSAQDLVRQLADVINALTRLKAAMAGASDVVHGRNFQTATDPVAERMRAEDAWVERRRLVEVLHQDITALALAIQAQGER
jgi:hypothetical protein